MEPGSSDACPPCDPLDLETEWRELDVLPVVDTVRNDKVVDRARGTEVDRVICTLWCASCHPAGDLRQPSVKCNQSTVPSLEHAVRALRLKIVEKHAAASAAEAARAAAGGPSSRPPPDALAALMANRRAQVAADRAEAALKAAELRRDEARRALEAAEREATALRAVATEASFALPEAKRQRRHGREARHIILFEIRARAGRRPRPSRHRRLE